MIDSIQNDLHELDRCFGYRKAGMVVSGMHVPTHRDVRTGEDPLYLTLRVLVIPIMENLGYGAVSAYDVADGYVPGLVMSAVSMNTPLSYASSRVICAMRSDGPDKGIATDGFRWALVSKIGESTRVSVVSDLRPYYVEILDRNRFREMDTIDRSELTLFTQDFSKRRPASSCESNHHPRCLSIHSGSVCHGKNDHSDGPWKSST